MSVILHLLRKELEQGYHVVQFTPKAPGYAPTGEPYVKLEGFGAENEAREAFRTYAKDKIGTLYWRTWPEASDHKFYMRLLISDK